jgi:HEAT repeat protein
MDVVRRRWRRLAVLGLVVASGSVLSGCGKAKGPTLAGGKPIEHWVKSLNDRDAKVRKEAVEKLGNVGTADAAAIPALLGALKDKDARVRCEAILALAKSGRGVQDAIDALAELESHDRDPKVREFAAKGLKRLQSGGDESGAGAS